MEGVGASEATVRRDLTRLARDLTSNGQDSTTAELMAELKAAKTGEAFVGIQQRVMVALASHRMDLDEARFLFDACKELQRRLSSPPGAAGSTAVKARASDPFDLKLFDADVWRRVDINDLARGV